MTAKYVIGTAVVFAVLIFLRFVEDSPVRTWPRAIVSAVCLSFVVCVYLHWAFPKPLPPAPVAEKVENYRAALERAFRHIAGVDSASLKDSVLRINFTVEKSPQELRQIALETGEPVIWLTGTSKTFQVKIVMSVRGEERFKGTLSRHGLDEF
jgi:hypothetical protein